MRIFFKATVAVLTFLLSAHYISAGDYDMSLKTVVIDPGHGGKDPGAVSKDKKTYEKNVVLQIALELGEKIKKAYPDVNVVYTRTKDEFIDLKVRAKIANQHKADLFISVHINSSTSVNPNGVSAHILGKSSDKNRDLFGANENLCKRENAVIQFEEDESTYNDYDEASLEAGLFNLEMAAKYEQSILLASKVEKAFKGGPFRRNNGISQDPFYVLWGTAMPSVLLELGFISNKEDLEILRSAAGRNKITDNLLQAFTDFKAVYDGTIDASEYYIGNEEVNKEVDKVNKVDNGVDNGKEEKKVEDVKEEKRTEDIKEEKKVEEEKGSDGSVNGYGIQIFSLSRRLGENAQEYKGLSPVILQDGSIFRYVVEINESESATRFKLSTVKKKFPDAYIVKIEKNSVKK